jgi:multiple sugar transport system substrate-binding protein
MIDTLEPRLLKQPPKNQGERAATKVRGHGPWIYIAFSILAAAILGGMLSGCNGEFLSQLIPPPTPTENPAPSVITSPFPTQEVIVATPTHEVDTQLLTIWVPPQFNPDGNTPAGTLLKTQLDKFIENNPGVKIHVRVKALIGSSGLLDSLAAASAAAPSVVPSLIALPRSDLETAALKGLVIPLSGYSGLTDNDWYDYAKNLATIEGTQMGFPFAGDALLLAYRPGKIGSTPEGWRSILGHGQPVIFAASDPQALLTMGLYRSVNGRIQDDQNRPEIDSKALSQVLGLYADGARQGAFPAWLTQYQTDGQAWQAYSEQRANWVITWSSRYLTELPADTNASPLPPLGDHNFTLASGWVWALSDPYAERRDLSVQLAQFLVQSEFLSEWSTTIHYLPVRPSTLASWTNQTQRSLVEQIVQGAEVRPTTDLSNILGPIFSEATIQVIKNLKDPAQAAQAAAERVNMQ